MAQLKISVIRNTIDRLNWVRRDISGSTRDEYKRMDVPARYAESLAACRALQIPPRFLREIESRQWAIECAEKDIARWHDAQGNVTFTRVAPAAPAVAPWRDPAPVAAPAIPAAPRLPAADVWASRKLAQLVPLLASGGFVNTGRE